ncbi:MAG: glycosyltransferase family 4 protein [Candidatus Kapabacteria bacterium]|nr:glycosyltransferase family 4 protein [Candidatus Kapabacteria bacterium]
MNIRFFAHDIADAAVMRRVAMLHRAGAAVSVVGFTRGQNQPSEAASVKILGQTRNARFVHRIWAVLFQSLKMMLGPSATDHANVVIARNLEMLMLAVMERLTKRGRVPIIYECLDIHRLMLGKGPASAALRSLERWLLSFCSAIITSSPAYEKCYFRPIARTSLPVILIENTVFGLPSECSAKPPATSPPWIIAWNGAVRCAKSLKILNELTLSANGIVRLLINGRVSYDQIPDFHMIVDANPWIEFRGPYRYPEGLDSVYDGVHFNWTIDMFWEGQNSTWALANRIYEGGRAGVVPIAQRSVETGAYYERLGIGLLLDELTAQALWDRLSTMTANEYAQMHAECAAIPGDTWTMTQESAEKILDRLCQLSNG